MKKCKRCGQEKPLSEFNLTSYNRPKYHCRVCERLYAKEYWQTHRQKAKDNQKKYIQRNREFIWQYKLTHPCKCGINDPDVIEFHHTKDKIDIISVMVQGAWSIDKITEELKKCKAVCRNCHAKFHANERRKLAKIHSGSLAKHISRRI